MRRRRRPPPRLDVHVTLETPRPPPPSSWWRDVDRVRGIGAGLLGLGLILVAIMAALPLFR